MPKGIPNKTLESIEDIPENNEKPTGYGGIERAQQVLSRGGRWPRVKLESGGRLRFHFLTKGGDEWFCASKFHQVGVYPNSQEILCLHALTQGIETCDIHQQQAGEQLLNRFGCWVWIEHILHPHDNPDQEADSWAQVKVRTASGGERVMFKEVPADDDRPKFLRLAAGKGQSVFAQFTNAWMTSGDLRKGLYELYRVGESIETTYTLTRLKDDILSEEILEREDVQALPSIESIFRESLFWTPPTGDGLGNDGLDAGAPLEDLPVATPAIEDDLI